MVADEPTKGFSVSNSKDSFSNTFSHPTILNSECAKRSSPSAGSYSLPQVDRQHSEERRPCIQV
jgi:hypothetical protein